MNVFFQLWDTTTGNLVTEFDSEEEAIRALREVRAEDGNEPILEYALVRFQDGRPILVAKESDLVFYLARAVDPAGDSVAAGGRSLRQSG
ncbi:MAG: hypothetical protein H0T18_00305 [Chloroflexia bacterium]|nr:hypothetical protein [Chloroflexia bacterium]